LQPESIDILKKWLTERPGNDDVEKRLGQAEEIMSQAGDFDHIVVNYQDRLPETIQTVANLVRTYQQQIVN